MVKEVRFSFVLNRILLLCKERIDFKACGSILLGKSSGLADWSAGWSMG